MLFNYIFWAANLQISVILLCLIYFIIVIIIRREYVNVI